MRLTMRGRRAMWVLPLLMAVAVGTGCDDDDDEDDAGVRVDARVAVPDAGRDGGIRDGGIRDGGETTADAGAPLTEGQSAAVVTAINEGEIAAAMLAETRAEADAVQQFADRMITEHTAAQAMLDAVVAAEALTPAPNPVSMAVQMEAMDVVTMLTPLDGAAFDLAYMQSQVTMHSEALTIIDTRLLPGSNGDFRTFLTTLRADVAEHLEDAQAILDDLTAT